MFCNDYTFTRSTKNTESLESRLRLLPAFQPDKYNSYWLAAPFRLPI